jgi:type IV pilus assembly protein PilF
MRISAFFAAIAAPVLLTSCITTTSGGFNVQASEEQALESYIQLAIAYYDENDLVSARRHVNNALDLDDRSADAHNVLALIFQQEGDLDLADENYRRAISMDRTNSRVRNNYGALLFSEERYQEAYEQFEQVTEDTNYEGRAIAFENLGRSALQLDRNSAAINAFRRVLQLNPDLYISAIELAVALYQEEDWAGARETFQQYLVTAGFYSIPHTPRALLAGIQIEGRFQNKELVDNFALLLSTLYQDSPEYEIYQRISNAN